MDIDYNQLLNIGVAGIVLLWFMFRLEKKLDKLDLTLEKININLSKK